MGPGVSKTFYSQTAEWGPTMYGLSWVRCGPVLRALRSLQALRHRARGGAGAPDALAPAPKAESPEMSVRLYARRRLSELALVSSMAALMIGGVVQAQEGAIGVSAGEAAALGGARVRAGGARIECCRRVGIGRVVALGWPIG